MIGRSIARPCHVPMLSISFLLLLIGRERRHRRAMRAHACIACMDAAASGKPSGWNNGRGTASSTRRMAGARGGVWWPREIPSVRRARPPWTACRARGAVHAAAPGSRSADSIRRRRVAILLSSSPLACIRPRARAASGSGLDSRRNWSGSGLRLYIPGHGSSPQHKQQRAFFLIPTPSSKLVVDLSNSKPHQQHVGQVQQLRLR